METKEFKLFVELLDSRFRSMEERLLSAISDVRKDVTAEITALRKEMEYRFSALEQRIDAGLDRAADERKAIQMQNHEQDQRLKQHEERLDIVETDLGRYKWLFLGIGTVLTPVVIWGLIELIKLLVAAVVN